MKDPVDDGVLGRRMLDVLSSAAPVLESIDASTLEVAIDNRGDALPGAEIDPDVKAAPDYPAFGQALRDLADICETPAQIVATRNYSVLTLDRDGEGDDVAAIIAAGASHDLGCDGTPGLEVLAAQLSCLSHAAPRDAAVRAAPAGIGLVQPDGTFTQLAHVATHDPVLAKTDADAVNWSSLYDAEENMRPVIDIYADPGNRSQRVAVLSTLSVDGMRPSEPDLRALKAAMPVVH